MKPNDLLRIIGLPIALILGVALQAQGKANIKSKEVTKVMKTAPIGRFCIKIPAELELAGRSSEVRSAEITETEWPSHSDSEKRRTEAFNEHLGSIQSQPPPEGKQSRIVKVIQFTDITHWSKGILYYSEYSAEQVKLDVLLDSGKAGVWIKMRSGKNIEGNIEKICAAMKTIANAYRAINLSDDDQIGESDTFYLQHGAIDLPYKYQESTYARFEGHPLDLKLEVDMTETYTDEPKDAGLLARTAAAIFTGFAMGVDIDKIRSGKRNVAGLKGEEQVVRMTDKDGTELDFTWRYAGKKDSGENPKIVISMESPDGNLKEKLKIWDAILDSIKPLYKTHP